MRNLMASLSAALVLASCATTQGQSQAVSAVDNDPFEGWNRGVYAFNESVDKAIFGPLASGYRMITTKSIRTGVSNVFTNLEQPSVFANTLLQGKPRAGLHTLGRFVVNTSIGLAGIFDPATEFGIEEYDEDFAQTLGKWGFASGPYLMLPFGGPSDVRGIFGDVGGELTDPMRSIRFRNRAKIETRLTIIEAIAGREAFDDSIEFLRSQPEPYIALRREYIRQRDADIRDSDQTDDSFEDLPEFDDYDSSEEGT